MLKEFILNGQFIERLELLVSIGWSFLWFEFKINVLKVNLLSQQNKNPATEQTLINSSISDHQVSSPNPFRIT